MSVLASARRDSVGVRDRSTEPLVERLFTRISEVSSIPHVALQIVRVANDPMTGAEDLHEVIQRDAALAMRIMRTVNSSYYGLQKPVADLKRAITLLGFKEIRNLVLSSYVAELFKETAGHGKYTRQGLWNHLVGVGAVARLIGQTSGVVPAQEAYLAGLLHDLGLILIDQYLHTPFCRVVDALSQESPICHVEREILGFDHAVLGQFVATHWQLPDHLATAIGHHHASDRYEGPHQPMVHVVELANIFCHLKDRSSLGVRNTTMPHAHLFARLRLQEQDVARIWSQVDDVLEAADSIPLLQTSRSQ